MCLCFLGELHLPLIIGIEQFLVAGLPDAIEDCSCKAIDGEDLPAAIAKVNEDKHFELL
jgi:hypothetical protein